MVQHTLSCILAASFISADLARPLRPLAAASSNFLGQKSGPGRGGRHGDRGGGDDGGSEAEEDIVIQRRWAEPGPVRL